MRSRFQACTAKNIHFATRYCFAALIGALGSAVALAGRLSDRDPPGLLGGIDLALRPLDRVPKGGHFGAFEPPTLLVVDLRAFFRPLR